MTAHKNRGRSHRVPVRRKKAALRFSAAGGPTEHVRAALATPLLVAGAVIVSWAGRFPAITHLVERVVGRLAERLVAMRLEVGGLDRVDSEERYVVIALHEGFADALALLRLPLDLSFAARDELFEWPTLGRVLRAGRHPRVDTTPSVSSTRRFLGQARSALDRGDSLVIFAQGSILGIEIAFQKGAERLVRSLGYPVLPVVLTGSHRVWEHPYSATLRTGQRVSMRVLEPIPANEVDGERFRQLEQEMKRDALEAGMAPARRFDPGRDGWWDGYHYEIDPDFPDLAERLRTRRAIPTRPEGRAEQT